MKGAASSLRLVAVILQMTSSGVALAYSTTTSKYPVGPPVVLERVEELVFPDIRAACLVGLQQVLVREGHLWVLVDHRGIGVRRVLSV